MNTYLLTLKQFIKVYIALILKCFRNDFIAD